MRPRRATLLLLVVATVGTLLSPSSHALVTHHHRANGVGAAASSCFPKEREALLAFKQGITDDPAGLLHSWNQGEQDCCKWRGIRCSNWTAHVIGLHLGGTFLVGQISPSLLSLRHLEHLDLSVNNLTTPTGSVPEFLGLLRNLRYLDLSYMSFTGRVPSSLGNLSKLHYLDLSENPYFFPWIYNSNLYSTDISWLSNLPLRHLSMGSVNLSKALDWAHVVNMIPSLKVLRFPYCRLASANQSLPYLNLTGLEDLTLSGNYFNNPLESCWLWNLTGLRNLDIAGNDFWGQIPDSLGGMTSLQVLDLSSTFSSTVVIKANTTNLCNLEILDIRSNYMIGNIMDLLPHCSPNKLKELHLQNNNFTGVLPNWIGHRWSTLLILELYSNQFSGPVPSEIASLNILQHLDLSQNRFDGSVPSEISRLHDLLHIDLSLNSFNGPVPSEILTLSKLTYIDLSNNNLTGTITLEHLAGLTNLTTIDLSSNYLKIMVDPEWSPLFMLEYANFASCEMGPLFPVWLKTQANIVELNLSSVSIFDRIPDWFFTAYSNADTLDISNNAISGTLPKDLVNMKMLNNLYLNSNQLTGPVPQLPVNLHEFDISENSFSGPLSSSFGTQNLEYLNLASNRLTGSIPHSICQMEHLGLLNIANNYFDGEFPLCTEPGRPITILILQNNKLSGNFPSSLKIWTDLYILDLAWNKFSGRLPMWIGDLLELEILQLSHNMFTGSIPSSITRLKQLSQLNLAGNRLSGLLPPYLSNLTGMTKAYAPTFSAFTYPNPNEIIRADSYRMGPVTTHVNLSVITKGQERYYKDSELHGMVSIDLSSNQLFGAIPEEITSLDGVINLNLSWNQFSGIIPGKIGHMQSLESLDLKENNLVGEIPRSLSNITYLSYLDLSHNNLSGTIPSGGQLDTLYALYPFMYSGNMGLCGLPLQKNCSNNSEPKHGDLHRDEHGFEARSFSFGVGIGYLVGLWVVFCLILFKKSWRIAYFQYFDMAFDRVYVLTVVTWARVAKETSMHIKPIGNVGKMSPLV